MATKVRAEVLSTSQLSTAIDKAVKIAADRHQLAVSETNIRLNWELVGRQVLKGLNGPAFAADVSTSVAKATGLSLQPATLQVGKQIWCGYFEKSRLPIARGF